MVRAGGAVVALLVAGVAACGPAWASGSMTWSAPIATGAQLLRGVSCPAESFCAAVGPDSHSAAVVYTSRDPADGIFRRSAALPANVEFNAVSCPSESLCVAVGDDPKDQNHSHSVVAASTDPTGNAASWKVEQLNTRSVTCGPGGPRYSCNSLTSVSCPSVSLCVAVDWSGEVVTSTDPSGPSSAWRISQPLYGAYEQCDYGTLISPLCHKTTAESILFNVSCPSESFCLTGDNTGNVFSSSDPTAGAGAWHDEDIDSRTLFSVSCASASLCVAGDASGNVLASSNPAGGPSAWSTSSVDSHWLPGASCPSASFCVLSESGSNVLTSSTPTGGPSAWTSSTVEPNGALSSVACASIYLCVLTDASGNLFIGTSDGVPASAADAALRQALEHSCSGERVARVRRQHGCPTPFTAPGPGALKITWLGAHNTKLASGRLKTASSGQTVIRVRLTHAGNRALSQTRRKLHIKVIATFTDLPGHVYSQPADVIVRR